MQFWRIIQLIVIVCQNLAALTWLIPYPVLLWMCINEASSDNLVNKSITP
ncbi:hypothetical protein BH10CYA1_BH10CYA1_47880 [soil metagenome]